MTEAANRAMTVAYSPDTGTLKPVVRRSRPPNATSADAEPEVEPSLRDANAVIRVVLVSTDATSGGIDSERRDDPPGEATDDLVQDLRASLFTAYRLQEVSDRIGTNVEETLAALTALARRTPAGAGDPAASLSEHEETELREAGSLAMPMPALDRRASAGTTVAALQLLSDALSVKQAARRLRVTDGRVRQRLTARTLLGVATASGWKLPAFQFTDDGQVRGLDQVLPAMPDDVHPLVVRHFLNQPNLELPVAGEPVPPREWLISGGDVDRVVMLAGELHAVP